ncbi:hypothetical protein [Streptomyces sp. JV184]|uniref:hypothetical protein n=1 Tax=Streptomyces sp. JV184 TaxID=858637 RepID=UPI002E7A40E8|nr:hypothetical protein [Streptomyces sp. JV184]MEE1745825.1 hypothetical protein [Streptomyces sp. JV184]
MPHTAAPQHPTAGLALRVVLPGEDPTDVTFDEAGTPPLEFAEHSEHGVPGWRLSYREPEGNGVEDWFIPGDLDELGWAWTEACAHLAHRSCSPEATAK